MLCCKESVREPFAVVNADDCCGPCALESIARFLDGAGAGQDGKAHYCMAGYVLDNTLTENGSVSRGVCRIDERGMLAGITEHTQIVRGRTGPDAHRSGRDTDGACPRHGRFDELLGLYARLFLIAWKEEIRQLFKRLGHRSDQGGVLSSPDGWPVRGGRGSRRAGAPHPKPVVRRDLSGG